MKNFLKIFLGVVVFCGVSFAATVKIDASKLVGTQWRCESYFENEFFDYSNTVKSLDTYISSKEGKNKLISIGTITEKPLKAKAKEITYKSQSVFDWSITEEKYIVFVSESILFYNEQNPDDKKNSNTAMFYDKGEKFIYEIIKLDDKELVLKDKEIGTIINCKFKKQ